jgi:hypothetical protein
MKNIKAMTPAAAARIQSSTAKANGGVVPKGSFAARAQSAAVAPKVPNAPSKVPGQKSGGGRGNAPVKK